MTSDLKVETVVKVECRPHHCYMGHGKDVEHVQFLDGEVWSEQRQGE